MRRFFGKVTGLMLALVGGSIAGEAIMDTTIPCPEAGCEPVPAHRLSMDAMGDYLAGRYESALAQYLEILDGAPTDSLARVGRVMAMRRLGQDSEAVVVVRKILRDNPRDAAAALAYSDLLQPNMRWNSALSNADSCWFWARRAVALDSNATDAWMSYWVEAMMRAQDSLADKAIRHLARLGQWTPATQAMNRFALEVCPRGAVVLLGGDADYMGMRDLQVVHGVRRDLHLEGTFLDVPRYLLAQIRAGKIPPVADSAKLEAMNGDPSTTLTLGARITLMLRQQGAWPVVVLSWTKGRGGWELLHQNSRTTQIHNVLDGKGDTATELDRKESIQKLLAIEPAVFAGPSASVKDMSPIRRAAPRHAENFYMLATMLARGERDAGRLDVQARLVRWRDALKGAVPAQDASFHGLVARVNAMEAGESSRLKASRPKGKAKGTR
jgi:tetratricopeptide (TPR) repeat protein